MLIFLAVMQILSNVWYLAFNLLDFILHLRKLTKFFVVFFSYPMSPLLLVFIRSSNVRLSMAVFGLWWPLTNILFRAIAFSFLWRLFLCWIALSKGLCKYTSNWGILVVFLISSISWWLYKMNSIESRLVSTFGHASFAIASTKEAAAAIGACVVLHHR